MSVDDEKETDNFCSVHSKFQKFAAAEFISKQSKVSCTFFLSCIKYILTHTVLLHDMRGSEFDRQEINSSLKL